jgi:hypothetical protein
MAANVGPIFESLLDNPVGIFSPFDGEELKRLRGYVDRVERLVSLRFFQQRQSVEIMGANEGVITVGQDGFDEEALMAVAGIFRMLYLPHEKSSFTATMNLLLRHVSIDAPQRAAALAELREIKGGRSELLKRSDIAMVLERRHPDGFITRERMSTETLIDLWLHGHFLHDENEKSQALDQWPIKHIPLFEFCGAIRRFARLFVAGRLVVVKALEAQIGAPAS